MSLRDWLDKVGKTPRRFATDNGIAIMTIYKHLWQKQRMSVRIAMKIEEITQGQVTAKELVFYEG